MNCLAIGNANWPQLPPEGIAGGKCCPDRTKQNIFICFIPELGCFYGLIIKLFFMIWVRTVPPMSFKAKPKKTSQGTNVILQSTTTVKMASCENGDIKSNLAGHIATPQHIFFVLPLGSIGNFSACCSLPLCVYVCVLQTPEWLDSDSCQKCDQPFFWNFKQMWDSKKIGLRQVCMCPLIC